MKKKEHLKTISSIISKFLKDNGGYSNGLSTHISGYITKNSVVSIRWRTPAIANVTYGKAEKLGLSLGESIRKYVIENKLPNIIIESDRKEHDIYHTFIFFEQARERVALK